MMQANQPTILLKEERHTPHAVSFKVIDLNAPPAGAQSQGTKQPHPSKGDQSAQEPEIKKRLEGYSQQQIGSGSENLSREAIAEKLKRAEAKRNQALLNRTGVASPRLLEERRKAARDRKKAIDEGNLTQARERCERDIQNAEEKRRQTWEERRSKLRKHFAKVEEVRKEQAERRQTSQEKLKQGLEKKIENASQNRDEKLENIKHIAHHSAEKKKHQSTSSMGGAAGSAYTAYDEKPLPTHQKDQNLLDL